jgi:hypothetical protein
MSIINIIRYNFKRHIELLNHQKKVLSQHRSFFEENQEEFLELSKYNGVIDQHIFWENRFEVASIIKTFLNKKIDAHEFHDSVFGLRRNHIEKCNRFLSQLLSEEIKEFVPNKESYKLKRFLSSLYFECEHFEMDWDEKKFYNSIRNGFVKMQDVLEEDSIDFLKFVDQLNWEAKDQYFKLIEEFLGESSSFLNFKKKYESHVKVAKKSISNSIFLEPSYQALGFSNFSRILIQLFERYQVDPEISPKIFKSWVRKILLEMKNHYS